MFAKLLAVKETALAFDWITAWKSFQGGFASSSLDHGVPDENVRSGSPDTAPKQCALFVAGGGSPKRSRRAVTLANGAWRRVSARAVSRQTSIFFLFLACHVPHARQQATPTQQTNRQHPLPQPGSNKHTSVRPSALR